MKKEDYIKRYGEAAYEKMRQQSRDWGAQHYRDHPEEDNAACKKWREDNPDKVKAKNQEGNRKGGKYYEKMLIYKRTGLPGERARIRMKHWKLYHTIKQATPNSQIHHEWIPGTAKYRGVALVEKEAHENEIIKVIKVLEGKITIFTEKEIKGGFKMGKAQKFKAWDKKQKKWLGANLHMSVIDGVLWWQFGYGCGVLSREERESIELAEYTGKTDKKGNEIYGGDILKCEDELYPLLLGVYLVEWSDEECGFICERQKPYTCLLPAIWHKCEIAGNMFESPELLEEAKRE